MVDTATFTAVDLSRLPAPAIVEPLDYDTIYAQYVARLQALLPDVFDALVESDPAIKVLEIAAYRELLLRARINDGARAVMPAFAIGADLDNLAASFGIARLVITPADPLTNTPATLEGDDAFRRRLVLAPEGYSVAGPQGAYIFHALSADAGVLDASVTSPTPGQVLVTILGRGGDGTASAALLAAVDAYLSAETRRPLTDQVIVQAAQIVSYGIQANVTTFAGPDAAIVLATGQYRLADYVARNQRLGRDITRAGIIAALFAEGVENIVLNQPAADIVLSAAQCGFCTGIEVDFAGIGE